MPGWAGQRGGTGEAPERAARLWGAAEHLWQAIGYRSAPAARATYTLAFTTARTQLGEEAFATAWEQGGALTLDQAISYALEDSDRDGSTCQRE